jgi:hypothetical protein
MCVNLSFKILQNLKMCFFWDIESVQDSPIVSSITATITTNNLIGGVREIFLKILWNLKMCFFSDIESVWEIFIVSSITATITTTSLVVVVCWTGKLA